MLVLILLGLIGGAAVGLQGPMSSAISQRLGPLSASLIIHIGGGVLSAVLLILVGGESIGQWRDLPAPYFLTGLFGVGLFIVISMTIPRVGAAGTTTLIVAGQFVVAMLIDQFGWFGVPQSSLSLTRIAGAVLLVAGAYLISLSPAST